MQVAIGDAVEVWSQSNQAWVNGHVSQVFTETLNINGQVFPAGTIEVTYVNGAKKAVPPEHLGTFVRKSQSAIGYAPQPVAGEDSASDSSSGSESEAESSAESQASSKSDGSKAAGPDSSSTSKQELQEAIKKLEEEDRVDLEDPVALAAFLVTANIKLIRAEYLVHLVTEDRRLPRRQEAEGENFVDSAGKTRSALVDHEEVEAWAAGSKEAIIASVSHAWEAREHPDPCGYQLEMVAQHASLFVAAFAAEIWLFFDYVSLFQFKREKEAEEQSFRRSMGNMHAMYAHESTITFRVESLTLEHHWQEAVKDGSQVTVFHFHDTVGLVEPVVLQALTRNTNAYLDRGWCRAEVSWSSVRGDTAQHQRIDIGNNRIADNQSLQGRTPVAPDVFAADMHSAAFTHRSDADAVIDLQKKVFLEKVTRRRKLKLEGLSANQMQALAQSLRHFKQLKSITVIDFRCDAIEANAFMEALAATPIDKISLRAGRSGDSDCDCSFFCLLKALLAALESKTLKATHWNLSRMPREYNFYGVKEIAVFLKSTAIITDLDLSENAFGDKGAEVLAEALKENRTLKRLNLAHTGISVRGVEALKEALQTNTSLEQLELDERSGIDLQTQRKEEEEKGLLGRMKNLMEMGGLITQDTPEQAIEAACRANPRICKPSAAHSEASDGSDEEPFKSPFEAAVRIKGLADRMRDTTRNNSSIQLEGENICDAKMKTLADALRLNKSVRRVNLRSNKFGDEGLKALAEALRVNRTIFTLDLRGNNFGDEGLKALASAIEGNQRIHRVRVMEEDKLAMLSDEGRQAMEDIERFCTRNQATRNPEIWFNADGEVRRINRRLGPRRLDSDSG